MRVHEFHIAADIPQAYLVELSKKTSRFLSEINLVVEREDSERTVDAKSILGLISVPMRAGTRVRLVSKGKDEEEALDFVWNMLKPADSR